mgnify:CR=1 FL=1
MEKEEKAKVILDYDKYQELLKRLNEADSNTFEVAHKAYYRAVQENEKHINVLKERIAHLEIEKGEIYSALSELQRKHSLLKHDCVDIMNKGRYEGYIDFTSKYGNEIYSKVMDSLDKSLKTILALSFWNYFTGKADRVFCDSIRTCVGSSIKGVFFRILEQTKS